MDGMLHFLEQPAAAGSAPHLLGILYAEDFDDPPARPAGTPACPSATLEPQLPPLTQDDVDLACTAAVQAARAEWEVTQHQLRASALASIASALAGARDVCERTALAVAEASVATMLSMLSGALPHLCRDHGPGEVSALLTRLLPTLRTEPRVTVRVHPDLLVGLQHDLAQLEPELAGTVTLLPAPLEPGDLKVTWQNGSLARDANQILAAMQDALGQLGLWQRLEVSPERSLAHAE